MKTNIDVEKIVLSDEEKRMFSIIQKNPGISFKRNEVNSLYLSDLIYPEIDGYDEFGGAIISNRWRVSNTGNRYIAYKREMRRTLVFKSILCPIVVSILTNLAIHGVPLLLELLSSLAQCTPS